MADSGTFRVPPLLRLVKSEDTDPDPDSYGLGGESSEEKAYLDAANVNEPMPPVVRLFKKEGEL